MRLKGTSWDILGQIRRLFDEYVALRLFSQSFPTILTRYRFIEKNASRFDGRTDRPSHRDAWTHLKTILGEIQNRFLRFLFLRREENNAAFNGAQICQIYRLENIIDGLWLSWIGKEAHC